ncbi:MAG: GrpB family protein [Bacteroidales bacterium]|nr:GrpB family protein [Bacteroidales bacterium]
MPGLKAKPTIDILMQV